MSNNTFIFSSKYIYKGKKLPVFPNRIKIIQKISEPGIYLASSKAQIKPHVIIKEENKNFHYYERCHFVRFSAIT